MKQIILVINTLLKFKAYTLINVLGLACSMACVLTITRYIHQENTVNQKIRRSLAKVKAILEGGVCYEG